MHKIPNGQNFVQFGSLSILHFCSILDLVRSGFCPIRDFVFQNFVEAPKTVYRQNFSLRDFVQFWILFNSEFFLFWISSSSRFFLFGILSVRDFVHSGFGPNRDLAPSGFCTIRDFFRSGFCPLWDFVFRDFVRKRTELAKYGFGMVTWSATRSQREKALWPSKKTRQLTAQTGMKNFSQTPTR